MKIRVKPRGGGEVPRSLRGLLTVIGTSKDIHGHDVYIVRQASSAGMKGNVTFTSKVINSHTYNVEVVE